MQIAELSSQVLEMSSTANIPSQEDQNISLNSIRCSFVPIPEVSPILRTKLISRQEADSTRKQKHNTIYTNVTACIPPPPSDQ